MIGITKQISEKLLRAEAGGKTTRTKADKHGIRDRPQGTIEQASPTPGHLVHDILQKWYFSLIGTEDLYRLSATLFSNGKERAGCTMGREHG